jgi:acyl CoA:acetate/3-ketoacid CoA transferase alpha subunit
MDILQSGAGELIQPFDMDEFREWNRTQKSRKLIEKLMTEQEAVSKFVYDGCYIGTELFGAARAPMSLTREVIRQDKKNLSICGQGAHELDLWIAAGLVKKMDVTYVGLEVYGLSASMRRAIESGQITCVEWSNAAMSWRFKAAAMGVPFLPVRSMLGTDTLAYSAAVVVKDPFTGAKVALMPAMVMDVALIHVHRADKYGNCQIDGISGIAVEMARACKRLIISAEEIIPIEEIRKNPDRTIIPYYLVDAVVHAPYGSHPGDMAYYYGRDEPGIKKWADMSKTAKGAKEYLDKYVYNVKNHDEYLEMLGKERLAECVKRRERRET